MDVTHLTYKESGRLLHEFSVSERSNVREVATEWKNHANYIWIIKKALSENEIDTGIGFLSYNIYPIADSIKSFIYIVKIHVLKDYRGDTPTLIDGKRASQILFDEVEKIEDEYSKSDIDIITLISANEELDKFYKDLGFKDLPEGKVTEEYSRKISTADPIMYRIKQKSELKLSDGEEVLFGVQ